MQPKTEPPRDTLTATQVTNLIEAESLSVSAGLELLDSDDNFVEDISDDLAGGEIVRGNYRQIHGTCRLSISRQLSWGSQRVKPYMTLSDGSVEARFNLGVYLLSTPETVVADTPGTWSVDGFDKLEVLRHPHGSTYTLAAGSAILSAVTTLIQGAGETKILLDQTSAASTTPSLFSRPIDEQTTTLGIINDLLSMVGYRALWVDWNGYYRSEPYESPATRAVEWTYDTSSESTTVSEERVTGADYFDAPNRIVMIRDDPAQALPVEGNGIVTRTNQSDGPTSIDSRGRTITEVRTAQVASQTALETLADRAMENAKSLIYRYSMRTGTNPLHSHFDVVQVNDAQAGVSAKYLVTDWTLPLSGEDMTVDMKQV